MAREAGVLDIVADIWYNIVNAGFLFAVSRRKS
jgi:hypothetical protein